MATNTLAVVQANGLSEDTYWQKRLLGIIAIERSEFVFQTLGVEKVIPRNQSTKTFTMRRYNRLPVVLANQLLAEGVAPDALKIEGQKISGTVKQYGALIKVTDVSEDIHFDNIRSIYQPELARHALETIERDIMASFSEASEYFVGNKLDKDGLLSTDILTFADLRRVALKMKVNLRKGHSKTGTPIVVVKPEVMQDLLDDDALQNKMLATGMDNAPIKNGSLKSYRVYDMFVQETLIAEVELMPAVVGTGTVQAPQFPAFNVYTSYVLGFEPYIVLKLGSLTWHNVGFTASAGNELAQIASVGYKMWTGAKVIDPVAITLVYSRSNYDVVDTTATDTWAKPASQA